MYCHDCHRKRPFTMSTLAEHGRFSRLRYATLYNCTECDACFLPDDEFSSHESISRSGWWLSLDDAIEELQRIDSILSSAAKYSRIATMIANRDERERIRLIKEELQKYSNSPPGHIADIQNVDAFGVVFTRSLQFSSQSTAGQIALIKGSAVISKENPSQIYFTVDYTLLSAALLDGLDEVGGNNAQSFLRDYSLVAEPLIRLKPQTIREFFRLCLAPPNFFSDLLEDIATNTLHLANNDLLWDKI